MYEEAPNTSRAETLSSKALVFSYWSRSMTSGNNRSVIPTTTHWTYQGPRPLDVGTHSSRQIEVGGVIHQDSGKRLVLFPLRSLVVNQILGIGCWWDFHLGATTRVTRTCSTHFNVWYVWSSHTMSVECRSSPYIVELGTCVLASTRHCNFLVLVLALFQTTYVLRVNNV